MSTPTKSTTEAYDNLADNYESRWKKYLTHTHEAFLSSLKTSENDTILDISCGTGLLAQQLVDQKFAFNRLILNDISKEMLNIAKQRLRDIPRISFSQNEASQLPLAEHSLNKILCLNALHHYPNPIAVIQECRRVLRPEGKLYILDWNNSGFFRLINFFIRLSVPETISTLSLAEAEQLCRQESFTVHNQREWYWRYWKFYQFIAINN